MSKLDKKIKQSRRSLEKIDMAYSADMEKLKQKEATSDEIGVLSANWYGDRQLQEYELDQLLTRKLRGRASELDVPLPEYPICKKDNPDWHHNEHWYRTPMDGCFVPLPISAPDLMLYGLTTTAHHPLPERGAEVPA